MKVEFEIDRTLVFSVILGVAIVSGIYLIAAQTSSKPNPGHDWNEVACSPCITNANLADNSVSGPKIQDDSVTGSKIGCDNSLCRTSVNGNVGIGTASPSEKLNVNGSLRVDDSSGSAVLFVNATSGNVGIGTADPLTKLGVNGDVKINGDVKENGNIWGAASDISVGATDGGAGFGGYCPEGTYMVGIRLANNVLTLHCRRL